jgi:hypothetical protein
MPNQLGGTQKAVYTAQPRSNLLPTGHNAGKQWEHPCVHHERQSFYSFLFFFFFYSPTHHTYTRHSNGRLGKVLCFATREKPPFLYFMGRETPWLLKLMGDGTETVSLSLCILNSGGVYIFHAL